MGTPVEEKCEEINGSRCYFCRSPRNIQVHFIDGDPSNRDSSNLLPVCPNHHRAIHEERKDVAEWADKYFPPKQRNACSPK